MFHVNKKKSERGLRFNPIVIVVSHFNIFQSSNGADDDIERKIALQREELLRRERAREMIEPLDDDPLLRAGASAVLQAPWNAAASLQASCVPFGIPGLSTVFPIVPAIPPIGIVNPLAARTSGREVHKVIDMDVDEHPYRRRSPLRRKDVSVGRRLRDQREEEMRHNEEMDRLKRKEEELERKVSLEMV